MSNFSFEKAQEEKQSGGVKASTGIHDFKFTEFKVEEIKGKDGKPDWKKGKIVLEVTKTIEGKESVGKSMDYDILFPKDEESAEKLGKRLMHIFSKVSTKDKVEIVKGAIQKLNLDSIDTLMAGIKKIAENRSIRLKIVGDKNRQYPVIPLYYAGYAETIDTNPTELRYDDSTESLIKKDSSATEKTFKKDEENELPF